MTQSYSRPSQFSAAFSDKEQAFSDVIAAISEGKYSWACVLMLRSAGYNPLHYMPYRTYNRIIKANLNLGKSRTSRKTAPSASDQTPPTQISGAATPSGHCLTRSAPGCSPSQTASNCAIDDLSHCEGVEAASKTIEGGCGQGAVSRATGPWWQTWFQPS